MGLGFEEFLELEDEEPDEDFLSLEDEDPPPKPKGNVGLFSFPWSESLLPAPDPPPVFFPDPVKLPKNSSNPTDSPFSNFFFRSAPSSFFPLPPAAAASFDPDGGPSLDSVAYPLRPSSVRSWWAMD